MLVEKATELNVGNMLTMMMLMMMMVVVVGEEIPKEMRRTLFIYANHRTLSFREVISVISDETKPHEKKESRL